MRERKSRGGAVTVEFALTAPLLFLFLFAGIEFSRVNMIRNTVENAAYEGARRGVVPGASVNDCEAAAQTLLDMIRLNDYSVTISPSVIQDDTTEVTVTVDAPITASNGYVTPQFYLGRTVRASVTLPREMG